MADLTITSSSVVKVTGSTSQGTAGAAITAGDLLYIDTSDSNKLKLADANNTSLTATIAGIALCDAASGQEVVYQKDGTITIGATVAVGTFYTASQTAGAIADSADLTTSDYFSVVGYGISTTVIQLKIDNTGAQHA